MGSIRLKCDVAPIRPALCTHFALGTRQNPRSRIAYGAIWEKLSGLLSLGHRMDYVCAEERIRVPDHTYVAQCVSHDDGFVFGKARKLFLHFRIIEGAYAGAKLFMAFNMRYDKKVRPGSKYFKTWAMVNGWSKPSRNAVMSPRLFVKKVYEIRIRTVKPQHQGKYMPEGFWYSVVDEIVKVYTGAWRP